MSDENDIDTESNSDKEVPEMTLDKARKRRDHLLEIGFDEEDPVLIEALPAVGKTYGVIKWASETGNPITVFTERHELYDQYENWATDDFNLTTWQLPVFHKDCPTVAKDKNVVEGSDASPTQRTQHDGTRDDIRSDVLGKYNQGVSGRELHERAEVYLDRELPCQHDDTCPYIEALERDPTEVDVLIGNFQQVFVGKFRQDRYLVFDEFPNESFMQEFSASIASRTVSNHVSQSNNLPFESWEAARGYNGDTAEDPDVSTWLDNRSHDRETQPLYQSSNRQIDARGPLLTEVAIRFDTLDNDWKRAALGDGRIAVQSPNDKKVTLFKPPELDGSKSVVALDGTPCVEKWELLLGDNLQHKSVFNDREKRAWLQEVLELQIIQSDTTTKPYHSGFNVTPDKDIVFIEAVKEREGREPSLISSLAAVEEYRKRGLDQLVNKEEHYNNLKGSGRFGTDRLGIVIGSPQPSDNDIQKWGAIAGHSIVRLEDEHGNKTKGSDLDFGPYGNLLLKDSRENEVLQAAMRFGRDEENGERGATVYVHTEALPDWVKPQKEIPKIHAWDSNKGISAVVDAIKNRNDWRNGEWKLSDLADDIESIDKRQVGNILKDPLQEEGYIKSLRREGRGNAHIWANSNLEDIGKRGFVEW